MSGGRTPADIGPVMVGVDGSHGSQVAVELAAWEAERRSVPLILVHGFQDTSPSGTYGWIPHAVSVDTSIREQARSMLTGLQQSVQARHPALVVRSTLVAGSGAGVLVELSGMASLVVTGSRGSGGFAGLLVGSVSAQVAAHAKAPVLVARPHAPEISGGDVPMPPPGRVIVGIDGSEESAQALTFALEEASARKTRLTAMFVWWGPPGDILATVEDPDQAQAEANQILADVVAGPASRFPNVEVERDAIHDLNTARTLIEASTHAGLVVVGSRGRGGFTSLLLGSVSRAVLGHAHCAVAIARTHA